MGEKLTGLKLLLRRFGAGLGDVALIWFDRTTRTATLVVGSDEIIDEAAAGPSPLDEFDDLTEVEVD